MVGITYTSHTREMPQWCAQFLAPECLIAAGTQAELSEFGFSDAQTITLAAGAVVAGSGVTLTLETALVAAIEKGTILDFGAGELFTLSKRAEKGATKITGTLAADVEGAETYDYPGVSGRSVVPEGTVVGRTYAERDAGTGFGIADLANDDEIFIVAFSNDYLEQNPGITLVRRNHSVYENKIPGWSGFNAAAKAKIRELYDCLSLPTNV